MHIEAFIEKLFEAAAREGFEAYEVSSSESTNFSVGVLGETVESYEVSETSGLSFRAQVNGKMGYASTEAYDDAAIAQLISDVRESASLNETDDQDEIYAGDETYPTLQHKESDIASTTAEAKIAMCVDTARQVLAADTKVNQVRGGLFSGTSGHRLRNSYGLDLHDEGSFCGVSMYAIARDGEATNSASRMDVGYAFADLDLNKLANEAAGEAVSRLNSQPVPTGEYRVILRNDVMVSMLSTFCGVFSAENAQKGMSLLNEKEGSTIAAQSVTLMDDPLLPGGYASATYDGEGSATKTKAVIENGTLKTLLHSRKTARKQGVQSTGNASRGGDSIHVAPTNLYFVPGEKALETMQQEMGSGLVITNVTGLHAGANPLTGDFSLLSKGYTVENGEFSAPVERITIAGNFYALLKQVQTIGSDLYFSPSGIGSPSMDVGKLAVSGK